PTPAATTTTPTTPTATASPAPPAGAPAPTATPTPKTADEQFREASERINNISEKLNKLGLPIGWAFAPDEKDKKYKDDKALHESDVKAYMTDPRRTPSGDELPTKALGLLLTAFAVSQGAPFWFDLLNKIIVIRSTVKPREKSREEGTKDKPPTPPPTPDDGDDEQAG